MSKPRTLYLDIDEEKCEWMRELIKAGAITDGEVRCSDITTLTADDVLGFRRVHYFAGIGVWDYALNLAGWDDSIGVTWTGSCPCPSFSCAGKGEGFSDPRHLWPHWFRLIRELCPATLFGEQVGAAIGHGWLDLVQTDLEGADYAVGKAVLGAHSAGAPHIRQRLYFCADTEHSKRRPEHETNADTHGRDGLGRSGDAGDGSHPDGWQPENGDLQRSGEQRLLAEDCGAGIGSNALHSERGTLLLDGHHGCHGADNRRTQTLSQSGTCGEVLVGSDSAQRGWGEGGTNLSGGDERTGAQGQLGRPALSGGSGDRDHALGAGLEGHLGDVREWRGPGWLDPQQARSVAQAGATGGFWADCDWWYGRDGKFRPIGPGISPLISGAAKSRLLKMADGASSRVGLVCSGGGAEVEGLEATEPEVGEARVLRLRGYGDAITAETAAEFIRAYMEARR